MVKEKVKESLLGTEEAPQLSNTTRATFMQHAIKDEETGEYFMTPQQFIDAVAPAGEDYVRMISFTSIPMHNHAGSSGSSSKSSKSSGSGKNSKNQVEVKYEIGQQPW